MKKIFSNLSFLIIFPLKMLRKANKNNFVWGLMFGALFSFFVNVFTIQIQEQITKQRVLEAIEHEIYGNASHAGFIIESAAKIVTNNEPPNPFYTFEKFNRDLWEQSTEPLQYVAQLPSGVQANVFAYYTITIPRHNEIIDQSVRYAESVLGNCYPVGEFLDSKTESDCKQIYHMLIRGQADTAKAVYDTSWKVLEVFHPTQDRLNNSLLRFLMGSDSVRVLSRE